MLTRIRFSLAFALLVSLIFAIPVFAGGWAVVSLDTLPANVVAGEPFTVGFTVLQHGKTPLDGLGPIITATLSKKEKFVVVAESDGKPGHYTATLTFPYDGSWDWSIDAFGREQPMPVLQVVEPVGEYIAEAVVVTEPMTPAISPVWMVRALALVVGAIGVMMAFRGMSRWAVGLVVLSLSVGFIFFRTGPVVPEVEVESESSVEMVSDSSMSDAEVGARLFVAKGCISCHLNGNVATGYEYFTIEMGAPDLTNFSASPDVLRIRLKDPAAVKSDTQMPNLGLREDEIEALIAFINAK